MNASYNFTDAGASLGPVNPLFHYSLELSNPAPWFQLAVFVGPTEYDLGHFPATADLTFHSASPLNLGMIGFLDGRDSINYLWSRTEIDLQAQHVAQTHWFHHHVPEPGPVLLLACGLCMLFWRAIWNAVR